MDLLFDTDAMHGYCTHPLAMFSTHTASSPTSTQLTLPLSVAQGTLPLQSVQTNASLPVSTSLIQHSTPVSSSASHKNTPPILSTNHNENLSSFTSHTQLHTVPSQSLGCKPSQPDAQPLHSSNALVASPSRRVER